MTQAIALEDLDWNADAMEALQKVAAEGHSFTAYSLSQAGLREPPTSAMWGMLFREAKRLRIIRPTWPPYVPSPRPTRKGGVCAQWKAAA